MTDSALRADFTADQTGRQFVGGVPFGGDARQVAAALRALADGVEANSVLVDSVRTIQSVVVDDFVLRTLVVKYHCRCAVAGE
jgi:hypothetical protein